MREILEGGVFGRSERVFGRSAVGAGSIGFRLLLGAVELADDIRADPPRLPLYDGGLLAFAVLALVGAAHERAFDEDVVALAQLCRDVFAEAPISSRLSKPLGTRRKLHLPRRRHCPAREPKKGKFIHVEVHQL